MGSQDKNGWHYISEKYKYLVRIILRAPVSLHIDHVSEVPYSSEISLRFSPKGLKTQDVQKIGFEHLKSS